MGDLVVDGKIMVRRHDGLDSCGLGQGPMVKSCEHGNESKNCMNGEEFLHQQATSGYQERISTGVTYDCYCLRILD